MSITIDIPRLLSDLRTVQAEVNRGVQVHSADYLRELCCRSLLTIEELQNDHNKKKTVVGEFLLQAGELVLRDRHA